VLETERNEEEHMSTKSWIHSAMLVAAAAIVATLSAPPAEAQQFSQWSAPVNLDNFTDSDGKPCSAVVNSTSPDANDTHPALSKDGLSLYFASTRPKPGELVVNNKYNNYHLWVTNRASLDSCWVTPMYLGDIVNDTTDKDPVTGVEIQDFAPNLAPDGHWLYFHSNRPTPAPAPPDLNCTGANLYVSYREDTSKDLGKDLVLGGWETPINLGCKTINTPGSDQAGPTYFYDEASGIHHLYYTQRPTGSMDTSFRIYVSACIAADLATCNTPNTWGAGKEVGTPTDAMLIVGLNSQDRNTRTAIRRDGLEMIISSGRTGSLVSENLWVSTRPTVTLDQGNWEIPQPVNCEWQVNLTAITNSMPLAKPCPPWDPVDRPGTLATDFVNSNAFDGGPALSWDGTELYFFRVLVANNMARTCTVPAGASDPDTNPYCRDLFVSRRSYLTNTALSSSANSSVFGQPVTFSATVSSAWNLAPTPSGTVAFWDGGTSLGTGTLASGPTAAEAQATFTTSSLAVGSHSVTGQYSPPERDHLFSGSSGSLTQNVEYGICPLYDQARSVHGGATFPIKLQLCDANGNDISSQAIIVKAKAVSAVSGFSGTPDAPGNANPDNDFRFDATLGSTGGYIFNLSTGGLASGTYSLQFTAGSDPVTHSVNFAVN